MKALVIISPGAGKGDHGAVRETIARQFDATRIEYEIHELLGADKPGEFVRARLGDGFDLVVAVGGDGTVSGAFDGLHGSSIPLAIIPTGTGNLIAREFGIPTTLEDAVALLTGTPRSMRIDAMKIGERVYVLNAVVGISAAVSAGTTRKSKRRLGRLAYSCNGRQDVPIRAALARCYGRLARNAYRAVEVAISNCGILAKTLYPNGPEILSDDSHIDICILGMSTRLDYVRYLLGIISGRRAKAQFLAAEKTVAITSRFPLTAQADGDIIGTTPLNAEVLPGALTVLVPPQS
jgi:diacylglycerol kinase family enzyme